MNENVELFSIVALDMNLGIGYRDKILYHNPIDMFIFREYSTIIQNCIVGRVTYNTLPTSLSKTRKFNIITRNQQIFNNAVCITNKDHLDQNKYVVIGGNEIYKMFSNSIKVWVITTHKNSAEYVDTYFNKEVYQNIQDNYLDFLLYEDEDILVKIYYKI